MTTPIQKKLTVIFRIEAGCLGPEGESHVARFCIQARAKLLGLYPDFIDWEVIPRIDKNLPEMDYAISDKKLSRSQATRYLSIFHLEIDAFEMEVFDELPDMIDQYFGR